MDFSDSIVEETDRNYQHQQFTESKVGDYIILDVLATSILNSSDKTPDPKIPRKQYLLTEDSFILFNRQSSSILISHDKRKVKSYIQKDQYQLIAQLTISKQKNNFKSFNLSRKIKENQKHGLFQMSNHLQLEQDPLQYIYYSIKKNRQNSINQEVKNNDYIKFGKQIYQTKIFSADKRNVKIEQIVNFQDNIHIEKQCEKTSCKYCLNQSNDNSKDLMISACECTGSMSRTHTLCLKNWINKKIQLAKNNDKVVTYDFSKLDCEICKAKYPKKIRRQDRQIDLIPDLTLNNNTLVLNKITFDQKQKKSHFVVLNKNKELSIGRGFYNQLVLNDMSVSRDHAKIIRCQNDRYYLQDKNAKFGTFIALKDQIVNLKQATLLNYQMNFHFKLVLNERNQYSKSSTEDQLTQSISY